MLARGDYYGDEEGFESDDGDHGEDESDAGDDDHYWSKFKIFNVSGSNSSTCLPRDSPKTAPVGGFGGKVMIMIIISVRIVWDECEMT